MAYTTPAPIDKELIGSSGRFYERCLQGQLYSFGVGSTALVANNATATVLGATAKPVIGIYNPKASPVNLVVLQTAVIVSNVSSSTVDSQTFAWVYQTAQAISTGSTPIQRNLGSSNTAQALAFACGTALTGLASNLIIAHPLASGAPVTPQPATSTSMFGSPWVEENNGSWIVPPGGFLGVMNTVSTTTMAVSPFIMWAELPAQG